MCGIAGVYDKTERPFDPDILKRMSDTISHRGPDGEGFFSEGPMALAHRRLAILDISPNGRQPMASHDGQWVIVFNGCIYNFPELKKELLEKGHRFNSSTDTEVIVEGLSAVGPGYFEQLNGMFAVAAYNRKEKYLLLSRDRFGVKPLYYWLNGSQLVFASEVKSILCHPDYKRGIDYGALSEYFTFQNLFTYRTQFRGIHMIPPGNTIRFDFSTTSIVHNSWWNFNFSEPDESMRFEDAVEGTKYYFRQAVERQLISDVPVGSYLSGGMDSGSITAIASGKIDRLNTFTCGFDMSSVSGVEANYDERRDAELMASVFKTEHYEQVINAGDLGWSMPKVVWHLEDIRVGMSYPNYYISRLASKFVKVCLQGTGGDELYGGYPWRYYRVFQSIGQQDFFNNYYNFWQRLVADEEKNQLFTNEVINQIDLWEPRNIFERVFLFNPALQYQTPEQHIQNSLYFEIKTFLPGLLIVGDKLSMANSLEERFPFLDNDLVNFAQKIPVRHKLGHLELRKRLDENVIGNKKLLYQQFDDGKNVLRKAMSEILPPSIINRKKQGFSSPDESWYRGENAAYVKKTLLGEKSVSSDFIQKKYVERIIDEHMNKGINHRLVLWSLLCFEWWCRKFMS